MLKLVQGTLYPCEPVQMFLIVAELVFELPTEICDLSGRVFAMVGSQQGE